jgi:hypothetical protein
VKKNPTKLIIGIVLMVLGLAFVAGCDSAADTANRNLSKAAENFEVPRRIVGVNGITDRVMFSAEGFCSYETGGETYDIICKQPDGSIERTTMAKSDNVTIIVTQMGGVHADMFRSRVIFRPETIIPNFDLSTSNNP